MPPNPLYRAKDPVNALRQLASDTPEYQELTNYLMARNAMPGVKFDYLGSGTHGQYSRNTSNTGVAGALPKAGQVSISEGYRGYDGDPQRAVATLGHELTHAAWSQIRQQIEDGKASPQLVEAFKKLLYNRKTNTWAAAETASKLNPSWERANEAYRASVDEMPAFAIGNSMNPSRTQETQPRHLDSTLATEFRILQELATRDAVKNPNKVNR
jgi:hypothetical protein